MAKTRAARRAAARAATRELLDLNNDVLWLILFRLPLAHDIARVAPTCRGLRDAARLALVARPFSSEVVKLSCDWDDLPDVQSSGIISVSVHGQRIVCAGYRGRVGVWDSGTRLWLETLHETVHGGSTIRSVAFMPDGERFMTAEDNGFAGLHRIASNSPFPMIKSALVNLMPEEQDDQLSTMVICVATLPDGEHFVVGLGNCDVVLLDAATGTRVHTFEGHGDSVNAVVVTRSGKHIVSGSDDGTIKVWSVAGKDLENDCFSVDDLLRRVEATGYGGVLSVAVIPGDDDEDFRILGGFSDGSVELHSRNGPNANVLDKTWREVHERQVAALVVLPDNQHALSGSTDATIKLFNFDEGVVLRTFRQRGLVRSLALLPDGLRFVSAAPDQSHLYIEQHGLAPVATA